MRLRNQSWRKFPAGKIPKETDLKHKEICEERRGGGRERDLKSLTTMPLASTAQLENSQLC